MLLAWLSLQRVLRQDGAADKKLVEVGLADLGGLQGSPA